jgi:hypothetical protein
MTPVYSGELEADPDNQGLETFGPSTLSERIGAITKDTFAPDHFMGGLIGRSSLAAAMGKPEGIPGLDPSEIEALKGMEAEHPSAQIPREDAVAKVKEAGLDKVLTNLPKSDTIPAPALQIMMDRAHDQLVRDEIRARGPGGFMAGALDVGTSLLMGAADPMNLALGMVPVVGEARFGRLAFGAVGESLLGRSAVRAGIGAARGAQFGVLAAPIEYLTKTQEGQDYTFADALHSMISGAGQFAFQHAVAGLPGDVLGRIAGRPLPIPPEYQERPTAIPGAPGGVSRETVPGAAGGVSQAYDVRSGAVASKENPGLTYIDPRIPELSPILKDKDGNPANLHKYLTIHEQVERTAMAMGAPYDAAHTDRATPAERAAVEADGVSWKAYTEEIDGYLAKIEHEDAWNPPPDPHVDIDQAIDHHKSTNKAEIPAVQTARVTAGEPPPGTSSRGGAVGPPAAPAVPAVDPVGAMIADLPERAREDVVRAAIVNMANGEPVRTEELLKAAAKADPKIERAIDPARAVFHDVVGKLKAIGAGDQEARYQAAVIEAYYRTRAATLNDGRSALDLYQQEVEAIRASELAVPTEGQRLFMQPRKPVEPGLFAEREAEGQMTLPGGERISPEELARRRTAQGAAAPLKPKVAQKPMDIGLFSDEKDQKSFFQSGQQAPWYYSAVARAVESSKQEKASPQQWLATIRNTAGVKPEEMEWLGLEDWLKEQKGSVSKQEIADYVRANAIEVREVAHGGVPIKMPYEQWLEERYTGIDSEHARNLYKEQVEPGTSVKWGPPNYSGQGAPLPGGENYRELLLTLPNRAGEEVGNEAAAYSRALREKYGERYAVLASAEERQHFENLLNRSEQAEKQAEFRSSHWDEPNVLAHIRFDDRVIDGRKTLHVAEIQSDWHQKGRREGYRQGLPNVQNWMAFMAEKGFSREEAQRRWDMRSAPEDVALHNEHLAQTEARARDQHAIPDAPFKTTWPELSLKRIIRYAAENGYDKLSWDTGETNAERYDLSKQVKAVWVEKLRGGTKDGQYEVHFTDNNGRESRAGVFPDTELPDVIGKELADRIVGDAPNYPDGHKYTGLDLKVGGEGMRGFYDKILPAAASKLAKKFGAKVTTAEATPMPYLVSGGKVVGVHTLDITPQLREAATEQGFPLFQRGEAGPRARITFQNNRAIIELFKSADRSSLLHEGGHLFLENLIRDASAENAPQRFKDDLKTLLDWFGVKNPDEITAEHHEQFARGFEQYLMEGKAPSSALAEAFEHFKKWLTEIYKSLANLGAPLSPEVRGVMDRMLATDGEIAAYRQQRLGEVSPADWHAVAEVHSPSMESDSIAAEKEAAALPVPPSALPEEELPRTGQLRRNLTIALPSPARSMIEDAEAYKLAAKKRREATGGAGAVTVYSSAAARDRARGITNAEGKARHAEAEKAFDGQLEERGIAHEDVPDEVRALAVEAIRDRGHDPSTALDYAMAKVEREAVEGEHIDALLDREDLDGLEVARHVIATEDSGYDLHGEIPFDTGAHVAEDRAAPAATKAVSVPQAGGAARETGGAEEAAKRPAKPSPRLAAAQAAAAEAQAQWASIVPTLSEEERVMFEDAFAKVEQDSIDRAEIVTQSAACLMGAAVA